MKPLTEQDIAPLWDEVASPEFVAPFMKLIGSSRVIVVRLANMILAKFGGLSEGEVREKERRAWNQCRVSFHASHVPQLGMSCDTTELHKAKEFFYPSLTPQPRTVTLSDGVTWEREKDGSWIGRGKVNRVYTMPHCVTPDDFEQCAKLLRESKK